MFVPAPFSFGTTAPFSGWAFVVQSGEEVDSFEGASDLPTFA